MKTFSFPKTLIFSLPYSLLTTLWQGAHAEAPCGFSLHVRMGVCTRGMDLEQPGLSVAAW